MSTHLNKCLAAASLVAVCVSSLSFLFLRACVLLGSEMAPSCWRGGVVVGGGSIAEKQCFRSLSETGTWNNDIFPSITPACGRRQRPPASLSKYMSGGEGRRRRPCEPSGKGIWCEAGKLFISFYEVFWDWPRRGEDVRRDHRDPAD